MPFEGLNFGLARPTVQVENPMDVAMKGLAMQNAQQQVQQGNLQTQQLQKQISDQQELQDALRGAKNPDEAMAKVQGLGTPTAQNWMKSYIEMKQKGTQLSIDQNKLANEHLSRVGGGLLSVANAPGATPQAVADYVMGQAKQGLLDPNAVKDTLSTLPTDPALLPAWSKLQAVKLGTAEHTLKLFTGETKLQDTGTGFVPVTTSPLTGQVSFPQGKENILEKDIGPGDLKKFASDIGALKPDGSIDMSNPDIRAKIHAMTTNMATVIQNQGAGTPGSATWSNPLADPGREAKAQAIARGEQPMLEESSRAPGNREVNSRAAYLAEVAGKPLAGKSAINLNYKALSDFEGSGAANKTIRALNTMTEHVDTARRLALALNSGDMPLINSLAQKLAKETGKPAPTNFDTLKEFLSGEVANVAAGGHLTQAEIATAADKLNKAQSPAQLAGALDVMDEVAAGKLVALNKDYSQIPGSKGSLEGKLTSRTLQVFRDVQKRQGRESEQPNTGNLPSTMVKPGTKTTYYLHPDGNYYLAPPK